MKKATQAQVTQAKVDHASDATFSRRLRKQMKQPLQRMQDQWHHAIIGMPISDQQSYQQPFRCCAGNCQHSSGQAISYARR